MRPKKTILNQSRTCVCGVTVWDFSGKILHFDGSEHKCKFTHKKCRKCGEYITFKKRGDRYLPFSKNNKIHFQDCKAKQFEQSGKPKKYSYGLTLPTHNEPLHESDEVPW